MSSLDSFCLVQLANFSQMNYAQKCPDLYGSQVKSAHRAKIPTKQQINDLSLFYPIGSFENGTLPYRTGTNESIHAKTNT